MIRERVRPGDSHGVPSTMRSHDDYQRVMRRIIEITEGAGDEPHTGELSDLLARAEDWEERAKG